MRLPLPRTTFGLVALVSLSLAAAALLLGRFVHYVAHEALEVQLDRRIDGETRSLIGAFDQGGRPALVVAVTARENSSGASDMGYLLVDHANRRLAGRLRSEVPSPGWREFLPIGDEAHEVAQALTTRLTDGSTLVVAANRTPIQEIDAAISRMLFVIVGIMMVIGIGGAWGLGAVVRRRLNRINATAQAIIAGDHTSRVPHGVTDGEFDRLAQNLNRMLDRNAELLENLRQVSSDIAHDLRTPLARQQQVLESALAGAHDPIEYRRAIETAAGNGREILDLFAALLRISEIETLDIRSTFVDVDLSEVIERVTDAFRPDVEVAEHRLEIDISPDVRVYGDARLLAQLLVNLIENGVRHTSRGTTILVRLKPTEDNVILLVADNGPGIPSEDRDKVLRRFARLEHSRTTPGYGLGLSMVAAIARAHFASLKLSSAEPGLAVEVELSRSAVDMQPARP
ncbi:sensor histidine kinase [Phenylobacterium immobile]|uniref:sensor histidine kinase n=1 Tax=Phenylobacterium immobile TaxID=21 RepID=UPI000B106AC4|nr:HAMP domain-containing sensor histidine kinase [Phenylobacterium immobile]